MSNTLTEIKNLDNPKPKEQDNTENLKPFIPLLGYPMPGITSYYPKDAPKQEPEVKVNPILPSNDIGEDLEENPPLELNLDDKHYQELKKSGIDDDIIALNFKSLDGSNSYYHLLYSDKLERTNTGRLSSYLLKTYSHLDNGGWWVSGVDLSNANNESQWGLLKPNTPRIDSNNKAIKYEQPPQTTASLFALKVSAKIWRKIAKRYGVELPENYKELPYIAFWQWVRNNPSIPIIITEGAKKAAALLSSGYVAIGLPGINMGCRNPKDEYGTNTGKAELIPELDFFGKSRAFIFCFDQDEKPKTIANVNAAIEKTAKLLEIQKCAVEVMLWGSELGKGIDDVIYTHGIDKLDFIYLSKISLNRWKINQLRRLSYAPNVLLNERYLGKIKPSDDAQVIFAKSPKGTGKSFSIREYIKPYLETGERKILSIMHRVQLGIQFCNVVGLPYIDDDDFRRNTKSFGLCINSLRPDSGAGINPKDYEGAILIFDEICQLIWHVLTDKNLTKERVQVLNTLKELINVVINSGGKIICADADLNNIAIDFMLSMIDDKSIKPWIIENRYKFNEPWLICNFTQGDPATLIHVVGQMLEQGKKILLEVTGKETESKFGSNVLNEYFKLFCETFPDKQILVQVDADTVVDKYHKAYKITSDINNRLNNCDLAICTPVIETGVSIEDNLDSEGNLVRKFDAVFGIFQGVQPTDSVRQFLSRYRTPVPRYMWINHRGINQVGNGSTNWKELIANERGKDRDIKRVLNNWNITVNDDGSTFSPALNAWAKMGALINLGNIGYRDNTLDDLRAEGHLVADDCLPNGEQTFILPTKDDAKNLKSNLKNLSEILSGIKYEEISQQEDVSDSRFEQLKKQKEKTKKERQEYHKGRIKRTYAVEVTPELVAKDAKGWNSKIKLHYFFDKGYDYLQSLDSMRFDNPEESARFLLDSNKSFMSLKILALNTLGLKDILLLNNFDASHPIIAKVIDAIENNLYFMKRYLGIKINLDHIKEKPIQFLQRVVGMIGFKFPRLSRKGKRGDRKNVYGQAAADFLKDEDGDLVLVGGQPVAIDDKRDEVFNAWKERDKERIEKYQESKRLRLTEKIKAMGVTDITQISLIMGHVDNIRERLTNTEHIPSWGDIAVYLAPISEDDIKLIAKCLTSNEKAILRNLEPNGKVEEIGKQLTLAIKAGKENGFDLSVLNQSDREELSCYIHPNYHYLLFPQSQVA
jgi:hypothetical protein